jgi:hypothetical protein
MNQFNPMQPCDLSNKTLSFPDGSFEVRIHERLAGDTYRVQVTRCDGRDVNFIMPVTGYCAGELYQQTKRLIRGLVPEWAAA